MSAKHKKRGFGNQNLQLAQQFSLGVGKKRLKNQKQAKKSAKGGSAYPAEDSLSESCGSGGIGEPPLSSDGVLDKNKLPPISETNVMGEL